MTERFVPESAQAGLLNEAMERKRAEEARKKSADEAKKHSPELLARIEKLVDFEESAKRSPEDPEHPSFIKNGNRMTITEEGRRRLAEDVNKSRAWSEGASIRKTFSVPIDEESSVDVTLSRAKHSATINLHDLDSLFVINPASGIAHVESKEHRRRPFDMHTPMGSSSDLGPVWSREATMDDITAYSELLDNVEMVDPSR